MSVYESLKGLSKDAVVYAFPAVLQRSLGLITLPIYSRILAPEDYGIMGMMAAITCFVGMLIPTDWDAAVALCYHDATSERDRRAAVTSWLYFHFSVALLLSIGLWLGSEKIAASFLGSPNERPLLYFLAGSSLLGTGTWPIAWTLLRIQKKKWWVISILTGYLLLSMSLSLLLVVVFGQARISQMTRSFRHGVCAFSLENLAFPTTSCRNNRGTQWVTAKTTPSASISTAPSNWTFTARPSPVTPDSSPTANSMMPSG